MKKLNLYACLFFAALAVMCIIIALIKCDLAWALATTVPLTVAWMAYLDYLEEKRRGR